MIAIGSDHGGYDLKQRVIKYLEEHGMTVKDVGCHSKASCDYPVFGHAVAKAVADGECEKGIVICTTGIGISISANKVAGVRCALCCDTLSARSSCCCASSSVFPGSSLSNFSTSPSSVCVSFISLFTLFNALSRPDVSPPISTVIPLIFAAI